MEDNITLIMHHGGCLERDKYRRLTYVRGEFCVWEKMGVDEVCLWDIEKMVKKCSGYLKVSKMWYLKPFKGAEDDLNICLNPLKTDKHFLDMVKVAKANENEVEIYAQHVVDTNEVETVPLSGEERCGLICHNLRGCNKQDVARRPKDWIDIEPEEENVEGNAENVGNVPGNAENHVAEKGGGVAENVGNDEQVAQTVNV
ncbi:hypothetical protein MTR_2g007200 [Medicago truncatula]|uniref:PB1-like domain-containing protein n=1 Tax=Medicago truncatula TaxID=3880 RepID=G7IPI7_MEDTR|nr:hypothetical protein MTR_2g007200 [Medicago truncatula]